MVRLKVWGMTMMLSISGRQSKSIFSYQPTTRKGSPLRVMVSPTGSVKPKSCSLAPAPSIHTGRASSTSRKVISRPLASL